MTGPEIARLVEVHRAAIRDLTDTCLAHEVARDACLPRSPLADAVRQSDDAEIEYRRAQARQIGATK